MKKREVLRASLGELVAAYADAARLHGGARESGDYKTGNKAADMIAAVYTELRRRGPDAQRALLPLLHDEDPGVRLWSASHALEFSPSEGEKVLESLIPVGRFLGLSARMTLEEWRKGRLRFP